MLAQGKIYDENLITWEKRTTSIGFVSECEQIAVATVK